MSAKVETIQVGHPRTFDADGDASKPWSSAIIKEAVSGPVMVNDTGIDGDRHADLVHHGGRDKAILAYAQSHYSYWTARYPDAGFHAGGFGENLTVDGIDEATCCVGDVFEIGSCLLEVTQPRQPCWKLSKRWRIPKLAMEVQDERRTGWYLRVLKRGRLQAGDAMVLCERPHPEITVAWALAVKYARPRNLDNDLRLASLPQLSESWKNNLQSRAVHGRSANDAKRLSGI